MRRAGYTLVWLGLLQAILIKLFELKETAWLASFGIFMLLGLVLIVGSVVSRMVSGQLRLRPWDALKQIPITFSILTCLIILARFVFPSSERSLTFYLIMAIVLAVVSSFQQTAYRKPT